VVSWDDQLSLFELAFEKYGAVDIVVCILLPTVSPPGFACSTNERQIPNAGIGESAMGVCMGDLKVVNGKAVAPKLTTLKVNLIGVFYSQQQHSISSILQYSPFHDPHSAVHLGMHYVKRNRAPDSWKAIVMMGSMGA
jgi:hypothetical protein